MQGQRLSKVLASAGIASRRKCETLIFDGQVTVNGQVILKPETHVSLEEDAIKVCGTLITTAPKKVYYLLNKPKGYLCTHAGAPGKKTIYDLFPGHERLFCVGRLDRDTTGLLLVTNDGQFANEVIHPSSGVVKEYVASVREEITHEDLVKLSKRIRVEGTYVRPVSVKKMRRGVVKIAVKEGKKREVRFMVKAANLNLVSLKRIRIGNLLLPKMAEGTFRVISEKEKSALFS